MDDLFHGIGKKVKSDIIFLKKKGEILGFERENLRRKRREGKKKVSDFGGV